MANFICEFEGVRGRNLKLFDTKIIITTKKTAGSLITGNFTDGEKTIYLCDVVGVQFKKSGLAIGYLQFETPSMQMNNKNDNFFSENTFTYENGKNGITNDLMIALYNYVTDRIEELKYGNAIIGETPDFKSMKVYKKEPEQKAYEAEKKIRCEAEEKARHKAEENAGHELEIRKKLLSTKTSVTKTIVPMNKPNDFQNNPDWKNEIATLSDNEIYIRYIDEVEWSETYRYHCYLELKKRNLQSIQIITNHLEEQNELKILPNGKGYICPLCGFSNTSFSSCAQCSYNPFENPSEETNDSEDEYVDIACPACGEMLSFLKSETKGVCPNCDTKFEIK